MQHNLTTIPKNWSIMNDCFDTEVGDEKEQINQEIYSTYVQAITLQMFHVKRKMDQIRSLETQIEMNKLFIKCQEDDINHLKRLMHEKGSELHISAESTDNFIEEHYVNNFNEEQ